MGLTAALPCGLAEPGCATKKGTSAANGVDAPFPACGSGLFLLADLVANDAADGCATDRAEQATVADHRTGHTTHRSAG